MNDAWASPIEVAIALWLLERELGTACIVPAIVAAGTSFLYFRDSNIVFLPIDFQQSAHLSSLA
jgi:hypothetical protein